MTPFPTASLQSHQTLNALGLDMFEKELLCVVRYFLSSFEAPDSQLWHQGFAVAVEKWGEPMGLPIAFATSKLVRAVLRCRDGGMFFHDPLDLETRTMVSDDEAYLLTMLHHMRRDETSAARAAVDALTHGQMDPDVIRSGLSFAARFSYGAQRRVTRPELHIVQ